MSLGLKKVLLLIGMLFFMLPDTTLAATLDLINFSTTPKSPSAREEVVLRLESFAVDLNTANIAWNVDKVFLKDGVALKEITLTTPDFGEKIVVDVVIITSHGDKIDKQFVLAPIEVDVLWEAQTYTPPFYKGKALPTFKSLVRVTAIPRFGVLTSNPKEYYYKWTYNRNQGAGEALGKNSIVLPMGYDNSQVPVVVEVKLPGTQSVGTKYVDIAGAKPTLVLYPRDPLLGIGFHHPVVGGTPLTTSETELTLYAVPYFFSLDNLLNGELSFAWEVDGTHASPGLYPRYLTLIKPEEGGRAHAVSLRTRNPKRILQDAHAKVTVSFTAE